MHSGSALSPQNPAFSATIGIAAIVLEGRPTCDDESSATTLTTATCSSPSSSTSAATSADPSASTAQPRRMLQWPFSLQQHQQSPQPQQQQQQQLQQSQPLHLPAIPHMQRLRQKLLQLKSSPSTSCEALEMPISLVGANDGGDSDSEYSNDGHVFMTSLQTLATTCLKTTPRSFNLNYDQHVEEIFAESGLFASGAVRPKYEFVSGGGPSTSASSSNSACQSTLEDMPVRNVTVKAERVTTQGVHCEQFLKKIGLIKCPAEKEVEEHLCSKQSEMCNRWQSNYKQLYSIISQNEPICIEVYLGPENYAILLEQWIIERIERPGHHAMTLQSLCSAIRSQMYFSQITAWAEKLRHCSHLDTDIRDNPRIKRSINRNSYKLKLDILYRIKTYDTKSCFNHKPLIHNFPDAMIGDNLAVKICLKSLPRTEMIPRLENSTVWLSNHTLSCGDTVMLDEGVGLHCNEKGKHQCEFDEQLSEDAMESCSSTLSHREKQLLKYKKRMMKRDRKKKQEEPQQSTDQRFNAAPPQQQQQQPQQHYSLYASSINSIQPPLYSTSTVATTYTYTAAKPSKSTQTTNTTTTTITSASSPHLCTNSGVTTTVATQTDVMDCMALPNCDFCGNQMQLICWTCDRKLLQPTACDQQRLSKADLLMQSIHRTPNFKKKAAPKATTSSMSSSSSSSVLSSPDSPTSSGRRMCSSSSRQQQLSPSMSSFSSTSSASMNGAGGGGSGSCCDNNSSYSRSECGSSNNSACDNLGVDISDCRLCKRQKTQHTYVSDRFSHSSTVSDRHEANYCNNNNNNNSSIEDANYKGVARNLANGGESKKPPHGREVTTANELLEPDQCHCQKQSFSNRPDKQTTATSKQMSPRPHLKLAVNSHKFDEQFKTPTSYNLHMSPTSSSTLSPNAHTSPINNNKIHPLYISCPTITTTPLSKSDLSYRHMPKVNLTRLFNLSTSFENDGGMQEAKLMHSSPIPIQSPFSFDHLSPSPSCSSSSASVIPVQKSNSAPTFAPHSPALSPRFLKQHVYSFFKRRSRHLSDRSSERSSIGSDEQFSDEDVGLDSPSVSPTKVMPGGVRMFLKCQSFAKRPLLGNLEESLLQRRLMPKFYVGGFKVLLGASGNFCPPQLTIPSTSYFYEFNGPSLCTPYVCEIRMPRKGYVVPRAGTIQATLLNPEGTVVRMFVIQYDFNDMPNLSQTFIRQRIVAVDENCNSGMEAVKSSEQMKNLRYAIHLRFQTSRSGRLLLHTDIRMLISRRTDSDTAAAHAKGDLESPNELKTITVVPDGPKYSLRPDKT